MIENQIRTWVEEQLALGEDPEILRQTLLELDIDEDEVMAVIPKNTVKQENHTNDFKTEQEKVMKQIIPELSTPPKPGKNIADVSKKKVVELPEPPAPIQKSSVLVTEIKTDIPIKYPIKRKVNDVSPNDKKLGAAKLKMIPLHAQHGVDSKTAKFDKLKPKKQGNIFGRIKRFFTNIFHKTKKSNILSEQKNNMQLGRAKLKALPFPKKQ